jgi:hypothetical protein
LEAEKWSLLVPFGGRKNGFSRYFLEAGKWSLLVLFGGRKNGVSWYFLKAEKMESPGTFWRQEKWSLLVFFGGRKNGGFRYFLETGKNYKIPKKSHTKIDQKAGQGLQPIIPNK